MVGVTWVLQDSTVDPLELSDALKDFARAMVGESSVELTSDRAHILDTAASEIESYSAKVWFRGLAGAPRVATSVVETDGPGDVPIIPAMPRSVGTTVTLVERWDDETEAFAPTTFVNRPLGVIRVRCAGTYRIAATVLPLATYPSVVGEAVARLFSYRESYKPRRETGELADGRPPTTTGAVMKSGAGELLRFIRTPAI